MSSKLYAHRILAFALLAVTLLVPMSHAQSVNLSYQVGAVGNMTAADLGVRVSILTNTYDITDPSLIGRADAFYVGSDLINGAFIQFGYSFQPGNVCNHAFYTVNGPVKCLGDLESIQNGDPRWFWQYWLDFQGDRGVYSQVGPSLSGGGNDTWHQYSIMDYNNNSWSFNLDDTIVAALNVTPVVATDPPFFAAEQVTSGVFGRLGPVEFRNLSYFSSGLWRPVISLKPIEANPFCPNLSYGDCAGHNLFSVTMLGANDMLAGSLTSNTPKGHSIWELGNIESDAAIILMISVLAFSTYYLRRKHIPSVNRLS